MSTSAELESAFAEAIEETRKRLAAASMAVDGKRTQPQLERLTDELELERDRAVERGSVDREWIQTTVRWLVEWVPDSDLTLIAAIGKIARIAPADKS